MRSQQLPKEPAGPAAEHSPYGVFVAKGPGIKTDERIYGAGLLDITPTILTAFGLPVGHDMDGKVLVDIFNAPGKIEVIPSWENVDGNAGTHPKEMLVNHEDAQAALQQLVELATTPK